MNIMLKNEEWEIDELKMYKFVKRVIYVIKIITNIKYFDVIKTKINIKSIIFYGNWNWNQHKDASLIMSLSFKVQNCCTIKCLFL